MYLSYIVVHTEKNSMINIIKEECSKMYRAKVKAVTAWFTAWFTDYMEAERKYIVYFVT